MSHSRLKQQCRIISNDCDDGASGRAGNSIAAEGKREWRGWNERVSLRRDEDRPKRWKPNTALISIQTMRGRVGLPGTILSFSLRTLRFYNSCEIVIKKTRAISIFVGEFSLSRYGKGKCCNRFTPRTGFCISSFDTIFDLTWG